MTGVQTCALPIYEEEDRLMNAYYSAMTYASLEKQENGWFISGRVDTRGVDVDTEDLIQILNEYVFSQIEICS